MSLYNLIEHTNNFSKASGSLWQYYWDKPFLDAYDAIADLPAASNDSALFIFKQKIIGKIVDRAIREVQIMVSLSYLSHNWRALEMPLINNEIDLILTWDSKYLLVSDTKTITFPIFDPKPSVPVVTLSTKDNLELLQQFKSGFKRTINWDKYQSKVTTQIPNPYLDYLIDSSFQEVNRLFVWSFGNNACTAILKKYYFPTVEIKDYNVMIDGHNFLDHPIENNLGTYENIRKVATGQGKDYMTGFVLDYNYFNKFYKKWYQ